MKIDILLAAVLAAATLSVAPINAIAVDTSPPSPAPDHAAGIRAIEAKDWSAAIKSLTAAAQRDPRNADVENLLGYAYRNAGQLDSAFQHYERALQINPRHLGTHEYIGEAYLMANNLAKAEEHLAALQRYCSRICEERDDLGKKIEEYRKRAK